MKLGIYKNLKVKGIDVTVSEAELACSITNMQRKNALFYHIDERPAKAGDVVVLNYEGLVAGKPFAGGKATHHRMVLGEGKMIPGFEDQIIGKTMGDEFQIQVRFPQDYIKRELAGREAVFATTLVFVGKEEIPVFDDDFALDFSSYRTAAELADFLKQSLEAKKEAGEYERIQTELLTQIIEGSEIPINQEIIDELSEEFFEEKLEELELQGMSLEECLKRSQQTIEDIRYQCIKKARRSYCETAVLYAIALEEGFEVYEEELEDELDGVELQILCDKAMELVRETAEYV